MPSHYISSLEYESLIFTSIDNVVIHIKGFSQPNDIWITMLYKGTIANPKANGKVKQKFDPANHQLLTMMLNCHSFFTLTHFYIIAFKIFSLSVFSFNNVSYNFRLIKELIAINLSYSENMKKRWNIMHNDLNFKNYMSIQGHDI